MVNDWVKERLLFLGDAIFCTQLKNHFGWNVCWKNNVNVDQYAFEPSTPKCSRLQEAEDHNQTNKQHGARYWASWPLLSEVNPPGLRVKICPLVLNNAFNNKLTNTNHCKSCCIIHLNTPVPNLAVWKGKSYKYICSKAKHKAHAFPSLTFYCVLLVNPSGSFFNARTRFALVLVNLALIVTLLRGLTFTVKFAFIFSIYNLTECVSVITFDYLTWPCRIINPNVFFFTQMTFHPTSKWSPWQPRCTLRATVWFWPAWQRAAGH